MRYAVIPERNLQEFDKGEYPSDGQGMAIWHDAAVAEAVAEQLSRPGFRFIVVRVS